MVQRDRDLTCRQARKLEADQRAQKRREARKAALDKRGHPVVEGPPERPPIKGKPDSVVEGPPERPAPAKVAVRLGLVLSAFVLSGCPGDGEKRELKGDKEVTTEGSSKSPAKADSEKKSPAKGVKTPSKADEAKKVPAKGSSK